MRRTATAGRRSGSVDPALGDVRIGPPATCRGPDRVRGIVRAMAQSPPLPRRLEYVPVDDLPDHPRNPRDHRMADLRASVLRFGFTSPPMVDGRTGLLAEGHGRKKATIELRDHPPSPLPKVWPPEGVVVEDGTWYVPVVHGWASTDDTEAEAYLLAGNQGGGWHNDVLAELLGELAIADALAGTQFTADDLDDLLAELGAGELPEQDTDAAHADLPERGDPAAPRAVQGLHEVGLMFQDEAHRTFLAAIAQLRQRWQLDSTPAIVLRALGEALK
jgi:hypothetical protein